MKFQRLLMIIFYLRIHKGATISELSRYLEVSRRTICRDMEMLIASGVDIISSPGRAGGYRLPEDFSFDKLIFSKSELASMLLSVKFLQQFKDTEFAGEADALSAKIEKLLEKDNGTGSKVGRFLLVDTEPGPQTNRIPEVLRCVENAYDSCMLLFIEYKSPMCRRLSTSDLVAPYGLVNQSGSWYIVGFCYELEAFRAFNVMFIKTIYITEKPFTRDQGFDMDKFWDSHKSK